MPKITLSLSDAALTNLQSATDVFNAQTGQALTLNEYILLFLKQRAIEKDILAETERIKTELDAEFPLRIAACRRELLDALDGPEPPAP